MAVKHSIEIMLIPYLAHQHCGTLPTITVHAHLSLRGKCLVNAALLCQSVVKISVNILKDTNMPNICIFRKTQVPTIVYIKWLRLSLQILPHIKMQVPVIIKLPLLPITLHVLMVQKEVGEFRHGLL